MDKQQIKQILDNALLEATYYCKEEKLYWDISPSNDHNRVLDENDFGDKEWFSTDESPSLFSIVNLSDLRTQLALIEENEKLKARALEAENIFYQLVEEQALYCSDFGNLLPVEDQDSEVVRKAIGFMNSHIQKLKELSND